MWQGRVADVITELERGQEELGLPPKDESETSPRPAVADPLRYLQNNQIRMKSDEDGRLGMPITSSHVESTVKPFNRRMKGTEKFWSEEGAEALLQLCAEILSATEPMADVLARERSSSDWEEVLPTGELAANNYNPGRAPTLFLVESERSGADVELCSLPAKTSEHVASCSVRPAIPSRKPRQTGSWNKPKK
jgi:hypothetical protein